jgi:hypothetical protein
MIAGLAFGIIILAPGLGFLIAGIMGNGENIAPLNVVAPLADEYNLRLLSLITGVRQ